MLNSRGKIRSTRRLSVESLEHRRVLATVTLNTDLGLAGELRTELASAAPNETIDFNLATGNETIQLTLGELVVDKPVSIDGANSLGSGGAVTISGGGNSRVLNISDGSPALIAVSLSNLTVTDGNSTGDATSETGGGVRNEEALTIFASSFEDNVAGSSGGGIGNVGGSVTMTDSDVTGNTGNDRGGGIHNTLGGSFAITNGTISGNTVTRADEYSSVGGGISSFGVGSVVTVADSTITGNAAVHDDTIYDASGLGGGLANDEYSVMTLTNTDVTSNNGDFGGGAWVDDGAELNVESSTTFSTNTAGERGGGVFADDSGIVNISDSEFDGNATAITGTGDGGAILAGSLVEVTIDNSTFTNNYAFDRGGAIYATSFGEAPGMSLTISNSLLEGNTAIGRGGAIATGQLSTTLITDTTLTGNSAGGDGGAINSSGFTLTPNASGASLTILDSFVTGNSATDDGGGIGIGSSITTNIRRTDISNNYAYDRGGAIYSRGDGDPGILNLSKLTINDSTLSSNTAMDDGGGLHLGRGTENLLVNSTVSDNRATDAGGGLRLSFGADYTATTSILNSTISGNTAADDGGGIEASSSHVLTVQNSTIDGNVAYSAGGGILGISASRTRFIGSTISNNIAYSTGGGGDITNAFLSIQASTISGNSGSGNGGGFYLRLDADLDPSLSLNIDGSTFTNNYGASAGGVFVEYNTTLATISNSIISGNTNFDISGDLYETGNADVSYSLIGDNVNTTLMEANPDAAGNIVGGMTGGIIDARLGALSDNGGPTLTHLPMFDSPVIDKGDPATVDGVDQRGFDRVVDGDAVVGDRVDMGSVEVGSMVALVGDFDNSGVLDCSDIDALVAQIVAGSTDLGFDVNTDGVVNILDITDPAGGWLRQAGSANLGAGQAYIVGDANLDGAVDGDDFTIWSTFKFSGGNGWCGADFDANGFTDGRDFLLWNANKFTTSADDSDSLVGATKARFAAEPQSRVDASATSKLAEPEGSDVEGNAETRFALRTAPLTDTLFNNSSGTFKAVRTPVLKFAKLDSGRDDDAESQRVSMIDTVFGQV